MWGRRSFISHARAINTNTCMTQMEDTSSPPTRVTHICCRPQSLSSLRPAQGCGPASLAVIGPNRFLITLTPAWQGLNTQLSLSTGANDYKALSHKGYFVMRRIWHVVKVGGIILILEQEDAVKPRLNSLCRSFCPWSRLEGPQTVSDFGMPPNARIAYAQLVGKISSRELLYGLIKLSRDTPVRQMVIH